MIYETDTFRCSGCGATIKPVKGRAAIQCDCGERFSLGWESIASAEHRWKNRVEDLILVQVLDEALYSAPHLEHTEVV